MILVHGVIRSLAVGMEGVVVAMDQIRTGGWEAEDTSLTTADSGWGTSEDEESAKTTGETVSTEGKTAPAGKPEVLGTVDVGMENERIETPENAELEVETPAQPIGLSVPEEIIEEEVEEEAGAIVASVEAEAEREQVAARGGEDVISTRLERGVDLREEKLVSALSQLLQSSNEIEAAALISLDGLMIASALPNSVEEDRVAAMSAAILSLGERAASELGRGDLSQVFLEGDSGFIFMMSTGGKAVLTALARNTAKLGLVFYDMKNAAKQIGEIL